jgi:hypothetical protein
MRLEVASYIGLIVLLILTPCLSSAAKEESEVAKSATWLLEAHKHPSMARTPHARADGGRPTFFARKS